MRRALIIGLPLTMLLAGGGAGWLLRDEPGTSSTDFVSVDAGSETPARPLPAAPNPAVLDLGSVVGLDRSAAQLVGPGSALAMPLSVGDTAVVVGATSFEPVPTLDAVSSPTLAPVPPQDVAAMSPLDAPPSTLRPPDDTLAEIWFATEEAARLNGFTKAG